MCETLTPASTDHFAVTRDFVVAGKAVFTVHGSGKHYTYKVSKSKTAHPKYGHTWYVALLTGPDNEADYTYMGAMDTVTGQTRTTKASKLTLDSEAFKALNWAMKIVFAGHTFPAGYGCHGEGRCGRCGRMLTAEPGVNPEGERFGFGPICWKILGH